MYDVMSVYLVFPLFTLASHLLLTVILFYFFQISLDITGVGIAELKLEETGRLFELPESQSPRRNSSVQLVILLVYHILNDCLDISGTIPVSDQINICFVVWVFQKKLICHPIIRLNTALLSLKQNYVPSYVVTIYLLFNYNKDRILIPKSFILIFDEIKSLKAKVQEDKPCKFKSSSKYL